MSRFQGTPEWDAARLGKVTASCFSDVLAGGKGITRTKYLYRVVAERLSGVKHEGFKSKDMERGHEQEAAGRMGYEARTGNIVEEVMFVVHPTILMVGCSPDGLIDTDGGYEGKAVLPHIQIETKQRGDVPPEHIAQIQGCMWITGRAWWDFCSYCPALPRPLDCVIYRVHRDDRYIANLEAEVVRFANEVDRLCKQLLE